MASLLTSLAILVAVVAPLLAFVVWKDRRQRAALDREEEVA
jgi:hypothetical protein